MRRGDLRQALTEAMRAVELNPRSPDAHFYLGLVHVAMGDVKAAITAAERLDEWLTRRNLKRYRADRTWHHLMGEIHLAEHDYQMAIDSHQRAVDLAPNPLYRDFYLHALGSAYYRARRLEEAVSPLEKVLSQNPNHADCLYTLALIYKEKGDRKLAKEYLSRFKKVFRDADQGVEWVEKAKKLNL
jgi:type IV pilus assembly protein PilF